MAHPNGEMIPGKDINPLGDKEFWRKPFGPDRCLLMSDEKRECVNVLQQLSVGIMKP
jgi:hypothetical protein